MFIDAEDDPNGPGPSSGPVDAAPATSHRTAGASRTAARRSRLQEEGIVLPPNQLIDIYYNWKHSHKLPNINKALFSLSLVRNSQFMILNGVSFLNV